MPEAIISAKGTEAPTVRSGRFTIIPTIMNSNWEMWINFGW